MLYLATCAVGGAFVAICWKRFVGILLGGFTVAVLGTVIFPQYFRPGDHTLTALSLAFLLGGGLGEIFPKFFFVFNSSLIGAVFATYGISTAVVGHLVGDVKTEMQVLVHLCIFLPLLIFGVLYQLTTSAHESLAGDAPSPVRA
jgi:ABC-type Na+ efflux pump permease subunit